MNLPTAQSFLLNRYANDLNSFADNVEALQMYAELVLENAAEKATATIKYEYSGNTGSEYCDEWAIVDKDSILNSNK